MILLSIILQEIPQFHRSILKHFHTRQINHSEMIRIFPVKSASMNDQNLLLTKQIKSKLLIICNVKFLCINFREDIKSSFWFYCTDTRDITQCVINKFSLFINTSTRNDVIIDTLMAAKCCLDNCRAGTLEQSRIFDNIFKPSI